MRTCSKSYMHKTKHSVCILLVLSFVLLGIFVASIAVGPSKVALKDIVSWLLGSGDGAEVENIIRFIRLPRATASILCGAALAVSGLLLQTTLGNALASPGVIGINSSAGFFAVITAILFPYHMGMQFIGVLCGAVLAAFTVCMLAGRGASRLMIVLSGVAISSMFSAGIDAVVTFYPQAVADRMAFAVGGFASINLSTLMPAIVPILIGLLGAVLLSPQLNVLLLGDETAEALGVPVQICRRISVFLAAVLAAGAVSICGLLGFVGLIVPNLIRRFVQDMRLLVPLTALLGAILVSFCDLLARIVFMPYEFPVGILLSFLGAPFFLYLIIARKGRTND